MAMQTPVRSSGVASGPKPESLTRAADLLGRTVVVEGPGTAPPLDVDDVLVIHVKAAEAESELPYAALADVLRPILHHLHSIPAPQADALRSAFALASPCGAERLALCSGTLGLLAAASPVVVVVDDAQWIDAQSAEPLQYSFRRLEGLRVGALLCVRAPGDAVTADPVPIEVADDPARGLLDAADAARAAGKPERALRLLDDALG